ncbi:symbiotic chitinase [Plectosphaerella plurivora]|uniref:chitinase n=1 Tax=Plectosphaerella plurivora TaxID=936078 RepID=A0A9P8VC43_9PEZI|nr:symbiotic chitinase [Plectosphaerella plurivora]
MKAGFLLLLLGLSTSAATEALDPSVDPSVPIFDSNRHFSFFGRRNLASSDSEILSRRDDYSCSAERPCRNGACCGAGGFCGYGPDYCGAGCVSNCDASAECGKFSRPANKKCPLNTCCSEHGFCGTSKDFCGSKCQSNCVEHPKPPGGEKGKTLSKVIGYWEAWNDQSKCHPMRAKELPLSALTHLNYAFAFIDPKTFEITPMDFTTPESTFDDVADLKAYQPSLQIFISLGGWTFSDNGTVTQPVFGNIARSSTNRKKFADILVKFLDAYGFDGVDLDWEYPGAPDRGGKPEDVENFVLLVKDLRQTFNKAGRKLGITFTAPSSYWYLKWFDLPNVMKYVDWVNLMSYDLHGTWDSNNPIGAIVQGHTNLTEIKAAAELFWRVGVKPEQMALGFGFYGRSFTLSDPKCTKPGCPFKGGAKPGVCTGTSGYLAYYEVQDILKKNKITPIHDKEAAVKYFTFDKDQWISYDDADTFKQKIEWADSVGFMGSLIWASDLDDYDFTAHKALTGKTIITAADVVKETQTLADLTAEFDASFGRFCYKKPYISFGNHGCGEPGDTKVGYDSNGEDCTNAQILSGTCGLPICCPLTSGFTDKSCRWTRNGGGDCNGRCESGEVMITQSSWGGLPGDADQSKCKRGKKAFCCKTPHFDTLTDGCRWETECGKACQNDEDKITTAFQLEKKTYVSPAGCNEYNYCCKKSSGKPLADCNWKGSAPDCVHNTCGQSEITIRTDPRGGSKWSCGWGRSKSLCCKPDGSTMLDMDCNVDLCKIDPLICEEDGDGDDEDEGSSLRRFRRSSAEIDDTEEDDNGMFIIRTYTDPYDGQVYEYAESLLSKRIPGLRRPMKIKFRDGSKLQWASRIYPNTRKKLFGGDGASTLISKLAFGMGSKICTDTSVVTKNLADLPKKGFVTEHFNEVQMAKHFIYSAYHGTLPYIRGPMTALPLSAENLAAGWNYQYTRALNSLATTVTDVKDWTAPNTPAERFMTVIGDYGYRSGLFYAEAALNGVKGSLHRFVQPMDIDRFEDILTTVAANGKGAEAAAQEIAVKLQLVFGTFEYMNHPVLKPLAAISRKAMLVEVQNMEQYVPPLKGILDIWLEFEPGYYRAIELFAQNWIQEATANVIMRLGSPADLSGQAAFLAWTAQKLADRKDELKFTFR